MKTQSPTENLVEDVAAVYFAAMGISSKHGAEIDDAGERANLTSVLLEGRLAAALHRLNPKLPHEEVEQVVRTLSHAPHPTLIQNNRWFHEQLTGGVEVSYRDSATGEMRGGRAKIVDFDDPAKNELLVVRQLQIVGPSGKTIRPDLTVFLNGMPIALIELKDPADTEADLPVAITQMHRYKERAPDLFVPNVLLAASDGLLTRVGSITAGLDRFMPWRPLTPNPSPQGGEGNRPTLEALIRGLFEPSHLLDYLRSCVAFEEDERGNIAKKIAGYHQFRAVRKTRASVLKALKPLPVQAESRAHLKQLLDRAAGGVVFTTIQKFTEEHGEISTRANVVVMADEAHRSQYGFVEGGAKWMRDALPGATFVGFTGTPLDRDDRSTPRVFGEYADRYDVAQAVDDGATVKLFYESQIVKLTVDDAGANAAEAEIEQATAASRAGTGAPENVRVPLEALVGAPKRIKATSEPRRRGSASRSGSRTPKMISDW